MVWQKDLRRASFRGIRFNLSTSDADFGVRSVQHEFPSSNTPYEEILGKKQQGFSIEGYVVGFDYNRQRDRVISACEDTTPGELIHPYFGTKKVVCRSVRVRETPSRGGVAEFSFVFVEAGELRFPVVAKDPLGSIENAADALSDFGLFDFLDKFGVASLPAFVEEEAVARVESYSDFMDRQLQGLTNLSDDFNDLAFAITDLRNSAIDLVRTPNVLYLRLKNSVELLARASTSLTDVWKEMKKSFTFGNDDIIYTRQTPTTPSRIQVKKNAVAFANAIQRESIKEGSKILVQLGQTSVQDAIDLRRPIMQAIDFQMQLDGLNPNIEGEDDALEVVDDNVYDQLKKIATQIIAAVPAPGVKLPNVVNFDNPITRNSLALSYELYGSVLRETDILDRNHVRHPGFIRGGQTLEVLSDVGG